MNSLSRRVDRIEEQLEPNSGPCLRWPNPDGTFIEVPGCRSLADVAAICRAREFAKARARPIDEH